MGGMCECVCVCVNVAISCLFFSFTAHHCVHDTFAWCQRKKVLENENTVIVHVCEYKCLCTSLGVCISPCVFSFYVCCVELHVC